MNIYTAQYRYSGEDRLDITVKGNSFPGKVLAPSWAMVRGLQAGTLNQWDYTIAYYSKIVLRMYRAGDADQKALDEILTDRNELTLVCFCKIGDFCHRVLAARMLEEMGYGKYIGERKI
jgi:hypothetical protein